MAVDAASLVLLRPYGDYWEAGRDFLGLLRDMQYRGKLNGEENASYFIPAGANINNTLSNFLFW